MVNFFKVILTVILSVFIWTIGSILLSAVLMLVPVLLADNNPNLESLVYWLLGNKIADHLFVVTVRGLPMLLAAWVSFKIHNESKTCYTISSIIAVCIIIAMQIHGVIVGDSNMLWLLEGAFVQITTAMIFRSEY